MNSWLIGFITEIAGVQAGKYLLVRAEDRAMAEAAAVYMGRTWWTELQKEYDEAQWDYPEGLVYIEFIHQLDANESRVLFRLNFLDIWNARGTPENIVMLDEYCGNWLDFVR